MAGGKWTIVLFTVWPALGLCLGSVGVCLVPIGDLLGGSLGAPLGVSLGIIWGLLEEVVDESSSDVVTVESVEDVAEVDEEKFMVVCVVEMFSANNISMVKFTSILLSDAGTGRARGATGPPNILLIS